MLHTVGPARMGAADASMAVLDPQLRVRGIEGLRVIDASSMPDTVRDYTKNETRFRARTELLPPDGTKVGIVVRLSPAR